MIYSNLRGWVTEQMLYFKTKETFSNMFEKLNFHACSIWRLFASKKFNKYSVLVRHIKGLKLRRLYLFNDIFVNGNSRAFHKLAFIVSQKT